MNNLISILIHEDIRFVIFNKLTDTDIYILHLVHKKLYHITAVHHRCDRLIITDILNFKSKSYLKFVVENSYLKKSITDSYFMNEYMFSCDNFLKIMKTNDIDFICSVLDISRYDSFIRSYSKTIFEHCNFDVIFYIVKDDYDFFAKNMFDCKRYELVQCYENMGIDLLPYLQDFIEHIYYMPISDLAFLKYIYKNKTLCITSVNINMFSSNLEYGCWVLNNVNYKVRLLNNFLEYIDSIYFPDVNIDLLFLMYEKGYNVNNIIYEFAYCNNAVHRLRPENRNHIDSDRTIIHDASNNIFNIQTIKGHSATTIFQYHIIYYLIKHNRFDLYDPELFDKILDINDTIILCKKFSYLEFSTYLMHRQRNLLGFQEITSNIYYNTNDDMELVKIYNKLVSPRLDIIISLHGRGLIKTCYYFIDNFVAKNHMYEQVSDDNIIYICRSGDDKLMNFIIDNFYTNMLFKYCKLSTLIKFGCGKGTGILFDMEHMLMYGDNEIVNYALAYGKFTKYSLCSAWLNNENLANWIVREHGARLGLGIDIGMCIAMKNLSLKVENDYYKWVSTINFRVDDNSFDNIIDEK